MNDNDIGKILSKRKSLIVRLTFSVVFVLFIIVIAIVISSIVI